MTEAFPADGLRGIDLERLRVLGRLILAKRMGKIGALLPATCRCASVHVPALMKEFATACPPTSLGRQENARQFHDFVVAYERDPLAPNYLADLARLEYMAATATFAARDRAGGPPVVEVDPTWTALHVRVPASVQLLETAFDLRAALSDSPPPALERGRPHWIAIVPAAAGARVFCLADDIASLLRDVGNWSRIRSRESRELEGSLRSVVASLAARGLLEVRPCGSAS